MSKTSSAQQDNMHPAKRRRTSGPFNQRLEEGGEEEDPMAVRVNAVEFVNTLPPPGTLLLSVTSRPPVTSA
jgi:hypothetical protein